MDERFGKKYKLCSQKTISLIFEKGKIEKVYPFLLRYIKEDLNTEAPFQIVISVPKRKFKKAVSRNRIKRLIREAVRKKKYILEEPLLTRNLQIALFLTYIASEEESLQKISDKIEVLFLRLLEKIE